MSAVKLPQPASSAAAICTLRGSVLTLAILTLVTFSYISLKSLRSPSLLSPPSTDPTPLTVQPSQRQVSYDADASNAENTEEDGDGNGGGDDDVYHLPKTPRKLTGKYSSEGYFFQNLRESNFVTDDPDRADLFFIPISCHKMRGKGISYENMTVIVHDYVESLISKYPYWNRTLGADHFFVTCHDVGVRATEGVPLLVKNSIRVVCSPSYDVGFIPHKDVALPQILQPFALPAGGNDLGNRTTLGFWAGHRNSKIRVILARVWENDTELDISNNRINRATGHLLYQKRFYRTKFCICPGGSQVNSARIADSIHYGCVPVILSNYYDLPFNDILNWHKFSVILKEKDVYQLKEILKKITQEEFATLHNNLVKVQKHFQWNSPPVKHDAFHMVMYELWLRHHVIKY
ncbi:UNVERIFIED_CONTAM: putative glycosyltransferase [Sesamum radiatum]|uniref:Glycosyltransferase n=1 Tax=Sesamum radiatum TaxID=300843 RepID=A0AAW2VRW5_SESRA